MAACHHPIAIRERLGARATAALSAVVALLAGCSGGGDNAKAASPPPAIPVSASPATTRAVPIQLRAIGTVQASASVTVTSQVDGQVKEIHFAEGQDVRRGQLLFTLDQGPFRAALNQAEATLARDTAQRAQAEANLARDTAQYENARIQQRRYEGLMQDGAISQEQYDQVVTAARALAATVEADRAAVKNADALIRADQAVVDNARIQLGYTQIRAPMDGRTGNLLVHPGNAVKARDTAYPMVVINQLHPVFVAFSVPEQNLAEVRRYAGEGTLTVEAVPPGPASAPAQGGVSFVNNTIDPTTGTIQLKATFPNADNRLWPGQFLKVVLTLRTVPDAVVVPSRAIQTGQEGPYVFVVKPDRTVEARAVVPGQVIGEQTLIERGLAPGDQVVTDGQIRLSPGARVELRAVGAEPGGRAT